MPRVRESLAGFEDLVILGGFRLLPNSLIGNSSAPAASLPPASQSGAYGSGKNEVMPFGPGDLRLFQRVWAFLLSFPIDMIQWPLPERSTHVFLYSGSAPVR